MSMEPGERQQVMEPRPPTPPETPTLSRAGQGPVSASPAWAQAPAPLLRAGWALSPFGAPCPSWRPPQAPASSLTVLHLPFQVSRLPPNAAATPGTARPPLPLQAACTGAAGQPERGLWRGGAGRRAAGEKGQREGQGLPLCPPRWPPACPPLGPMWLESGSVTSGPTVLQPGPPRPLRNHPLLPELSESRGMRPPPLPGGLPQPQEIEASVPGAQAGSLPGPLGLTQTPTSLAPTLWCRSDTRVCS